jgi:hypothetical protein
MINTSKLNNSKHKMNELSQKSMEIAGEVKNKKNSGIDKISNNIQDLAEISAEAFSKAKDKKDSNLDALKQDLENIVTTGGEICGDAAGEAHSTIGAVDEYTKPRESTGGDFKKGSYFQAGFNSVIEGFYMMGAPGVAIAVPPSLIGTAVTNKTGSTAAGVAAGAASGLVLGFAIGTATGGPAAGVPMGITGGLMGAMQTLRGDASAETRDAGGGARMLAAPFMPGISKVGAGIGASVGSKMDSTAGKILVGGVTAALIGGSLAAIGFAPVSVPVAVAASFAAGAAGPEFGNRFSQLFRNLSNDFGDAIEKGAQKTGLFEDGMGERLKNAVGTVPSSLIKEGVTSFLLSDGSDVGKMVLGGTLESAKQIHMFMTSEIEGENESKKGEEPENIKDTEKSISETISEIINEDIEKEFEIAA